MIGALPRILRRLFRLPGDSRAAGGAFRAFVASPAAVPLDLNDLLHRKPINLDTPELQRYLAGKVLLVTGAGGSIGSEICRQAMKFCPARLVLLEQAENALFEIDRELREKWLGVEIVPYIADINDAIRVNQIFAAERPQVVLHCAAHKHVPMMERNPGEAIKNNIFGTKTVADAASASGADSFVMVSTDKAVNPTSVMGAAKRFAELYIQSLNGGRRAVREEGQRQGIRDEGQRQAIRDEGNKGIRVGSKTNNPPPSFPHCLVPSLPHSLSNHSLSQTRFVAVRFGNVLGSSGSVVPIFQKQIAAGGPVTVTHPDMQRYFMTIPEASQLVLQAGAIAQGGEIFVLDMGEPMKILDLAKELIHRSGLRPGEDIAIEFTGVRPGEKLYEELAGVDEQTRPTSHEKIRVWQLPAATSEQVDRGLATLASAVDGTREQAVAALADCVPEYTPQGTTRRKSAEPHLRLAPAEIRAA